MRSGIRLGAAALAAASALLFSGCVKNRVVLRVNPDGSGDLLVANLMSRQMLEQVEKQMAEMGRRMAEMGGEAPKMRPLQETMFSERMLRHIAPLYGEVEFVAVRPLEQGGYRGAAAQYRFKDIGKVWLPLDDNQRGRMMGAMMSQGEDAELPPLPTEKSEMSIVFEWTPTAGAAGGKLVARLPEMPMAELADDPDWVPPKETEMSRSLTQGGNEEAARMFGIEPGMTHEQVLKRVFGEIEMVIELQVAGNVTGTTAKYPVAARKNAFTLFKMDFGQILGSRRGLQLFSDESRMRGGTPPIAKDVPGIEVETGAVSFDVAP